MPLGIVAAAAASAERAPAASPQGCVAPTAAPEARRAGPAAAAADAIVITSSRVDPDCGQTVVDRRDLDRQQPITVLEPLGDLAGVRAFSKGGLSYLSIRGGEPNFTLVLIDGVRVNDPTNSRGGAFDFEQIDPAAIERIEVARTALSPVHGADALSGAVHLRLRSPQSNAAFATARLFIDSRGGKGLGGTANFGWPGGGIVLSGSLFDSGDLYRGVDLDRRQGFAKVREELGGMTVSALLFHARAERSAFPEDSGGPRFAVLREREDRHSALTLAGVELGRSEDDRFQPHLAVNWSRQSVRTDTPAIAPGVLQGVPAISADGRFDRLEAVADVRLRLLDRLTASAGVSLIREEADSAGVIDLGFPLPADFAITRSARGLFGEVALDLAPVEVKAAVRYDDPSGERAVVTARAGANVALGRRTRAFGDYAEGYKLPSLFALAFPFGANPALRPERSRTVTVGLEQVLGQARVRVSLFRSRFRNLIDFDPGLFLFVNRARVRSRGVELEAAVPVRSTLTLNGALTYLDVTTDAGAPPLRSRPKWQGALSLDWRATDRLTASFVGRFNSRYFDSSIPTGLIVEGGHAELDATARWKLSSSVTLALTGRNLTSASYSDAVGFPAPSRTIRLGVEGQF